MREITSAVKLKQLCCVALPACAFWLLLACRLLSVSCHIVSVVAGPRGRGQAAEGPDCTEEQGLQCRPGTPVQPEEAASRSFSPGVKPDFRFGGIPAVPSQCCPGAASSLTALLVFVSWVAHSCKVQGSPCCCRLWVFCAEASFRCVVL